MLRLVLRPALRRAVAAPARPFAVLAPRLASTTDVPAPTKPKRSPGSGQGGKADKTAAVARKAAKEVDKAKEAEKKAKVKAKEALTKLKLKAKSAEAKAKLAAKLKASKVKAVKAIKAKATKVKVPKLKPVKTTKVARPDGTVVTVKKAAISHVLKAPTRPQNTWQVFLAEHGKSVRKNLAEGEKSPTAATVARTAAPLYRALSGEELAALAARVEAQKETYRSVYHDWISSLSPSLIKDENLVRYRRRRLGLSGMRNIRREGEPRKPPTAFFAFAAEVRNGQRQAEGELPTAIIEQSRYLAQAWRALDESERAMYRERCKALADQFVLDKKAFDATFVPSAAESAQA